MHIPKPDCRIRSLGSGAWEPGCSKTSLSESYRPISLKTTVVERREQEKRGSFINAVRMHYGIKPPEARN